MKYIVDTHILTWFLEDNPKLSDEARKVLDNPESSLVLPAIALAEAVWIIDHGRTSIPSSTVLLDSISADSRMEVYPLDRAVVEKTILISAINEMHDRQIVATALVIQDGGEEVALLTCDRNITASNLVPIIW